MKSYFNNGLNSILELKIPKPILNEITFLDIINKERNELIISKLYQYFLSSENDEKVASIFFTQLIELIKEKTKIEFEFESYTCSTEVAVSSRKRIDLLIESKEKNKWVIIIENKIDAELYNDLEAYYEGFTHEYKIGIVLSLKNTKIKQKDNMSFYNILHSQWLSGVSSKISELKISTKQKVYLDDFILTIKHLTMSKTIDVQSKFFFNHTTVVIDAIDAYNKAYIFSKNQLRETSSKLGYVYDEAGEYYKYFYKEGNEEIYYTILIDKLFEPEHSIKVIIELWKGAFKQSEKFTQALKDYSGFNNLTKLAYINVNKEYMHFLGKEYYPTILEIENLSNYLCDRLEEDFEFIMKALLLLYK